MLKNGLRNPAFVFNRLSLVVIVLDDWDGENGREISKFYPER
jgi:hypothetical protein